MVIGSTKRDGSNGTVDKNAGQRNPTSVQMPNDRRMNGNTHEHEHKRHDNDRKIFHHVHLPERAWPAPQNFTMTIKVKLADSQPSPPTTFNNVHDDLEPPVAHASLFDACRPISPVPSQHPHFPAQGPIPILAPELALMPMLAFTLMLILFATHDRGTGKGKGRLNAP